MSDAMTEVTNPRRDIQRFTCVLEAAVTALCVVPPVQRLWDLEHVLGSRLTAWHDAYRSISQSLYSQPWFLPAEQVQAKDELSYASAAIQASIPDLIASRNRLLPGNQKPGKRYRLACHAVNIHHLHFLVVYAPKGAQVHVICCERIANHGGEQDVVAAVPTGQRVPPTGS
jgi:hypothetical protein